MSDTRETRNEYDEYYDRPPVRRKRRKKTPWEKFKEAYLPLVLVVVGLIAVIMVIVGIVKLASGSGKDKGNTLPSGTEDTSETGDPNLNQPSAEAREILNRAAELAGHYDYDGAIALLSAYAGEDTQVAAAIQQYTADKQTLVLWEDPTEVPHISFQPLIVDTARAFDGDSQSDYYDRNNLTVEEFRAVLEQLYGNGYVLISMSDVASPNAEGKYVGGSIYLPQGKSPLIMSLVPAHYPVSRAGDGFARRLVVDETGKISCEYIDSTSTRVSGAYDFVTILEAFIGEHPDFSYHGSRAILGFSGDDEPLGYDITDAAEAASAKAVAQCLRDTGYEFASFTYDEIRYGDATDGEVTADVQKWEATLEPILGQVQILIYPGGSELESYEGAKFDALYNAGFRYFCGMDNYSTCWGKITDQYVRQDRRTINGTRITEDADLIDDLFDANKVVSSERP